MSDKIYAPNVHLYAFHLRRRSSEDAPVEEDYNSELLWEKCRDIFDKFHIGDRLDLREVSKGDREDLLKDPTDQNIILPLKGTIFPPQTRETKITGSACPLQIYDSYALWLNLGIPKVENYYKTEEVEISFLRHFNPDDCFLPKNINTSLGQTLLLTIWPPVEDRQKKMEEWRQIANECVKNFLGGKKCPPLYREGILFGSPIFEYGNPSQPETLDIFVWLFCKAITEDTFTHFHREFIELFFYRRKAIAAYKLSREVHAEIRQRYSDIENTINKIYPELPENDAPIDTYLSDLKYKLKTLLKLDLEYSERLLELEGYGFTIEVNTKIYTTKLQEIQKRLLNEDLTFLSEFNQKIGKNFYEQIKVELGYFHPKSGVVDKAIAAIRGIVEIEQTQIERKREEADKDRDRNLQTTIAVVGVGMGIGGVTATTYPYLKKPEPEKVSLDGPPWSSPTLHPLVESLSIGLAIGLLAALGARGFIYLWALFVEPWLTPTLSKLDQLIRSKQVSKAKKAKAQEGDRH